VDEKCGSAARVERNLLRLVRLRGDGSADDEPDVRDQQRYGDVNDGHVAEEGGGVPGHGLPDEPLDDQTNHQADHGDGHSSIRDGIQSFSGPWRQAWGHEQREGGQVIAVADDGVVDVFNDTASLVIPSALVVQQSEVPEDALGVPRERRVQLVVGQCHIGDLQLFRFIELHQHHGGVDAVGDGVVDDEAAVARRQYVVEGGEGDGGDEDVVEVSVWDVNDQAGVEVCCEGVVEGGSVQQDAARDDGELSVQVPGDGLHGA